MVKIINKKYRPVRLHDFDKSVRPADDFYQFVNGGWLKKTKIPPTENRWGSFYVLHDDSKKKLHAIVNDLIKTTRVLKGSNIQKLRDLYLLGMDGARRNKDGMKPLQKILERIEALKKKDEVIPLLAYLHQIGVGVFWEVYTDQDDKNSEKIVLRIHQGGLSMPDRDYYTKADKDSRRVRSAFKKHVLTMLKLTSRSVNERTEILKTVMNIELKLAKASMTHVELRNISAQYNKNTITELQKMSPHIDWKTYLKLIGVSKLSSVIVDQPKFLKTMDRILQSTSLKKIKLYLIWHLISAYTGKLSDPIVNESFNFYGRVIGGNKKLQPRWKRSLSTLDAGLGEALGELYVKKHFHPSAKKKMESLVKNLMRAYAERIDELDWMDNATKKKAHEKLQAIVSKIGYPEKWKSYKGVRINSDLSYAENCMTLSRFFFKRDMKKLGKPVDRKEWFMTPPTVNAYYSSSLNNIAFPAGILQPPFFNPDADDAINYGAIGAVIGHELTHGFDDKGSQFDAKGNHKNWWKKKDRKNFEAKTKVLINQFNSFKIMGGISVNGELTLGENIADLGGLVIAFRALRKARRGKKTSKIDGFTPEQRFFIGAAIADRGLYRNEIAKFSIKIDPHSPAKFRINGPMSNMEEFYKAFDVTEKDKMYRPPKDRVVIW
ncbi:M13 family metallopeptidase [Patescibacteria group bacterium]|nr:M13 family metallopeptidase [Patescibacteria group bacterium]